MIIGKAKIKKQGPNVLTPAFIDGRFDDGTLPVSLLTQDITVKILNSVDIKPDALLQLTLNGILVGLPLEIAAGDIGNPNIVFELALPMADFPVTGTVIAELNYFTENKRTGVRDDCEFPLPLIFDRVAPGGATLPVIYFTEDQLAGGITEVDLVNDVLTVSTSDWDLMAGYDVLTPWLGSSDTLGRYLDEAEIIIQPDDVDKPVFVHYPRAALEEFGDAVQYFALKLTDKAGNISQRSQSVSVPVAITHPIGLLYAPVVPAFEDHGLVTDEDARAMLEVQIPKFDNAQPGDRIDLSWGNALFADNELTAGDVGNDPMITLKLDYPSLWRVGSGTIAVNYQAKRDGRLLGNSPAASVLVDLTTPGGIDPDPETPVHENLLPLTVLSAGGTQNAIPAADFQSDAKVIVPRLGKDGTQVWELGDEVVVTWKDQPLNAVTINASNTSADLEVVIDSAAVIQAVGVGAFAVTYSISRKLSVPPLVNVALGPDTDIEVFSNVQLPGNVLAVEFPEKNQYNSIPRAQGLDGTPIRIQLAGMTNIDADTILRVRFVGINTETGSGEEIPNTEVLVKRPLGNDYGSNYVDILVPADLLFTICFNSSRTTFSMSNAAGTTNAPDQTVFIGMHSVLLNCTFPPPNAR